MLEYHYIGSKHLTFTTEAMRSVLVERRTRALRSLREADGLLTHFVYQTQPQ
jgi:hypothetical protein